MKKYLLLVCIATLSLFPKSTGAVSIGSDEGTDVNAYVNQVDKNALQYSEAERKNQYYRNVIDDLTVKIKNLTTIQRILNSRLVTTAGNVGGVISQLEMEIVEGEIIKATATLRARACIIPSGKSTCISGLTVKADPGKTFSVRNLKREITSDNLITPANYLRTGYYSVSSHPKGDAANYLTFGTNQLTLIENGVIVSRTSASAKCAVGTIWSGETCKPKKSPPIIDPIACTMEARMCEDGSVMPRNPDTCEWLPNQCFKTVSCNLMTTGEPPRCQDGSLVPLDQVKCDWDYTKCPTLYDTGGMLFPTDPTIPTKCSREYSPVCGSALPDCAYPMDAISASIEGGLGSSMTIACLPTRTTFGNKCLATEAGAVDIKPGKCETPLSITCTRTGYRAGEEISCKITGGTGVKSCWQTGKTTTSPKKCSDSGWNLDGEELYYYQLANTAGIGTQSLFVRDELGKTASVRFSITDQGTSLPKPTLTITRSPKTLSQGQSMSVSWSTTNADSLYYFCSGSGSPANTKVSIPVNKATYSETWERLVSDGWSGRYECDFVATGPGGTKTVADSFTITPRSGATNTNASIEFGGGTLTRNPATGEYIYRTGAGILHSFSCHYRPDTILGNLTNQGTINWSVAQDPAVITRVTDYVKMMGGNTTGIDPYGILFTNYPNTHLYCPTVGGPISFQANNCTIASGKSTCASSLYINASAGKTFSVKNIKRALTTSNLITPNNYTTIAGSTTPVYTVSTNALGDAANYIGEGESELQLLEGTTVVARAIMTGICAAGTRWDGTICAPVQSNINFQANNCTIASGKSTCASTLYVDAPAGKMYSVKNLKRALTTSNLLNPNNYTPIPGSNKSMYTVSTNALGDAANYIGEGENELQLLEGTVVVARAIMTGICATATSWDGKVCAPKGAVACTMEARFCPDGITNMPRDPMTCSWLPNQCTSSENAGNTSSTNKFGLKSFVTRRGTFDYTGTIIKYTPALDSYLTLRGNVGKQSSVKMSLKGRDPWVISTSTRDNSGGWELWNVNSDSFLKDGLGTYIIWDGINESSKTEVRIQSLTDLYNDPIFMTTSAN